MPARMTDSTLYATKTHVQRLEREVVNMRKGVGGEQRARRWAAGPDRSGAWPRREESRSPVRCSGGSWHGPRNSMSASGVWMNENDRCDHLSVGCGLGPAHSRRRPAARSVGTSRARVVRASSTNDATAPDPRAVASLRAYGRRTSIPRINYRSARYCRLCAPGFAVAWKVEWPIGPCPGA
jgi:hypothetical protein